MDKGFVIAGNMIMDILKLIPTYPTRHGLVRILEKSYSIGGLVNNVVGTLARLDGSLPIKALALIGEDTEGDMIIAAQSKFKNVDLSLVSRRGDTPFTDVLAERDSKARTFLFYPGSEEFDIHHVPIEALNCDIFHIGYIFLLPLLDQIDPQYGTRMARLLHSVQQAGIRTSVDVVSEVGDRYQTLIPPALKYADYFIVNEIEAGKTAGIALRDGQERLLLDKIPEVLGKLKQMGVARWAVIHAPEGGFGLDENGNYVRLPSLRLPEGFIAGTVGAGDAFCAGVLYAAYKGCDLEDGLRYGIAAASCSLNAPGGADGVRPIGEALSLYDRMEKQSFDN